MKPIITAGFDLVRAGQKINSFADWFEVASAL